MSKSAWTGVLLFVCATSAVAQESLLPTHISGTGEVTLTGQLSFIAGQGTLATPTFELDLDNKELLGELRVGVGIGAGFELEASVPYMFQGTIEGEESGGEIEIEVAGLGDLTLEGNYLITPGVKGSPNVMAGLVVVLPVGNDDFGLAEFTVNGTVVQDGEESGLGDGVLKVGLQFGVSQAVTGAVVYGRARFVVPTEEQEVDDVEVDHPEVFTLVGGAMVPIGDTSKLDLRLSVDWSGDEIAEELASESTEEAHLDLLFEGRFYFTVGDTATLVLTGGLGWTQDHALDEELELDAEQVFSYGVGIGLHLRLGVPIVSKR